MSLTRSVLAFAALQERHLMGFRCSVWREEGGRRFVHKELFSAAITAIIRARWECVRWEGDGVLLPKGWGGSEER